jgi:hypothetical protein
MVTETLANISYDCIMIGAGARSVSEHFISTGLMRRSAFSTSVPIVASLLGESFQMFSRKIIPPKGLLDRDSETRQLAIERQ